MDLKFPFPLEVRKLFIDCWACWICGGNGSDCGGLELHHIYGRVSASAFNAAVLCGRCHVPGHHNDTMQPWLLNKTLQYLLSKRKEFGWFGLRYSDDDNAFLKSKWQDINVDNLSL